MLLTETVTLRISEKAVADGTYDAEGTSHVEAQLSEHLQPNSTELRLPSQPETRWQFALRQSLNLPL